MRRTIYVMSFAIATAILWISVAGSAVAEPFKIAHTTWVGYGPLYLARDLGYFKEEGVEVELIVTEEKSLQMATLMGGKVEAVAGTVDEYLLYMKPESCLRYVVALDESNGGDGIVALKEIESVKDLKGRTVAANEGSVSQFWLNVLLKEAGLSQSDVNFVNMTATDAGTAFVAGRVDAAVTWEPHLTEGKQTDHGHLLVDSSATPGVIVDVIAVLCETAENRADEIKGIVRGWNRAVDYWTSNPANANEIMAKGVGGWLEDPQVFAETLEGVKFTGADLNKEYFGSKDSPLYQSVAYAIEIWSELGRLNTDVVADELITSEFLPQ